MPAKILTIEGKKYRVPYEGAWDDSKRTQAEQSYRSGSLEPLDKPKAKGFGERVEERKKSGSITPFMTEAIKTGLGGGDIGNFVGEMVMPQTWGQVGALAAGGLGTKAIGALAGRAVPWLGKAIAPGVERIAPNLTAGQRWLGKVARPTLMAAGGAAGGGLSGEGALKGAGEGALGGVVGETLAKPLEMISRYAGRPFGLTEMLPWTKHRPSIEERDLARVKEALARILPESAAQIRAAANPSELNNLLRGKTIAENASNRMGREVSGVESMMTTPQAPTQTGHIQQSHELNVPSMGPDPVTLRDALTTLQGKTARAYNPTTGDVRAGSGVPMAQAERVRLKEEMLDSLAQSSPGGLGADRLQNALGQYAKFKELGHVFGPNRESLSARGGLAMDPLRDIVGIERLKKLEETLGPQEFQDLMNSVFRSNQTKGWKTLDRDVKSKPVGSPDVGESVGMHLPGMPGGLRLYPHRVRPPWFIGNVPPQTRVGGYPTRGLSSAATAAQGPWLLNQDTPTSP